MDLRSDEPFWLMKSGMAYSYPSLSKDIDADVVIVGGGITGALIAHALKDSQLKTVIIDKRNAGTGSTCASTGLLQYEIDIPLHKLTKKIGKDKAERSYELCLDAIHQLGKLSVELPIDAEFEYKKSLFLAPDKDFKLIEKEYAARQAMNIKVAQLSEQEIKALMPASNYTSGLLSSIAAQVNPYLFTHGLLQRCLSHSVEIYDNTLITKSSVKSKDIKLYTSEGHVLKCNYVIYATGYEAAALLPRSLAKLHSTYAIISEPIKQTDLWLKEYLVWETKRPYLYLRTTKDNRILIGGKDEAFADARRRDLLLQDKAKLLARAFKKICPDIPFKMENAWCGTFAETDDGLPYIGSLKDKPNVFFALGYGGNGITFSMVAAQLIKDAICGKHNDDSPIFAFDRPLKAKRRT